MNGSDCGGLGLAVLNTLLIRGLTVRFSSSIGHISDTLFERFISVNGASCSVYGTDILRTVILRTIIRSRTVPFRTV